MVVKVGDSMANNNETTTRFNVDISQLKKGIQDAKRQISIANSEFRASSSALENWASSADGVGAKIKQLGTTLDAQETILKNLKQQYEMVAQQQGENSEGAERLMIAINNQQAAINKTKNELSHYSSVLDDIQNGENETGNESEELARDLDNLGDSAEDAESGFTVLKGAMANLLAEGIKKCLEGLKELTTELLNDANNAYAQFAAATGTATKAMGEYETAIKNVYKNNFGESLEDVAEKMAKVKEVTGELDASKLQEMTEKAMTLEDTFDMDMAETLRGAQALMNHFGMTAEEAFDLIASGAQNGLNYTDELGDNVAEYAAKFAEAGYSSEEYFQLLKNGAEGGAYNLDKINDAVNEVTTRLADGTIKDSLGSFSQKTQDVFKSWENGGATQKEVISAIVKDIQKTKGEQEKMNLAALAFGTMAEDGGTKFIEALTPVGKTFDDVKGKADELAKVKYDTPQAALQSIGRTLKTDLVLPLVEKLTPILSDLANWVTENLPGFIEKVKDFGNKVKNVVSQLEKWSPLLVAIGTAIATYLAVGQIASFVTWIKSGTAAIKAMEIAQAALNVVMNLNPIGIVVGLIAGLVAAFVTLWNKSDKFREFWIGLWDKIKDACGKAKEFIAEKIDGIVKFFTETIPNAISGVIDWIKNNWTTILTFLLNPFAGLFKYFYENNSKFKEFVDNAITQIKELPGKVWEWLQKTIKKVATWITSMANKAKEAGTKFVTGVVSIVKGLPEKVWTWLKNVVTKVTTWAGNMTTKARDAGSKFVTGVIDKVKELPSKIWDKFITTISKAGDFASNLKDKAITAGKNMLNGVIDNVKSLPSKITSIGKNIVEGMWNGISDKFKWLTDKIKGFASNVTDKLKGFFGIHSPSRVMRDEVGKYLSMGIAEGIMKNKDAVNDAMKNLADSVHNPLDFGLSAAKGKVVSGLSNNAVNGTNNATNNTYTFNQYNNSPKALSRLEIYRQTRNQLNFAKGV